MVAISIVTKQVSPETHNLDAGTYAFRIKTNPAISNADPCAKAKCDGVKGVQTVSFTVVAE